MKLKDLINKSYMQVFGRDDIEIHGLSDNSTKVKAGDIFFALEGTKVDGKKFAGDAVKRGAVAVVSRYRIDLPDSVANIVATDERRAMSEMASLFFGSPAKSLFIIGVTGTNGKTTTTFMLESIFKTAGKKVAIIGTNGIFIESEKIVSNMTTPDPIFLHEILAKMRDSEVDIVCMEMSAHALFLQKIWGIMTDIALFTNLTQDHLDFFKTMENYKAAKSIFFTPEYALLGVVNLDDKFGEELFASPKIPLVSYRLIEGDNLKRASVCATDYALKGTKQEFTIKILGQSKRVHLALSGKFNVYNALLAMTAGFIYGLDLETIVRGIESLKEVEGRFNSFEVLGRRVIIDYAHTPDGLLNILRAAREISCGAKVISVFGCGGDRDKAKRPLMGRISEINSDYTFITSDNPRSEDPLEIAKDIESGMKEKKHEIELDRAIAIKKAIELALPKDIVVISGKGAEDYLEIKGKKLSFSDKSVVENLKKQN